MIGTTGPDNGRAINSKLFGNRPRLATIQKYRCRIGEIVVQAAGFRERLGKREPPRTKCKLPLLAGCSERHERPRLREYVDRILRPNIDVVRRFVDERTERCGRLASIAIEHHPGLIAWVFWTSSACDCIEEAVAVCVYREARRCVHLAEHADRSRSLVNEGNDRLRLDRAILERVHDGLLDLDDRTSLGLNIAGIWNGNVAARVHRLVRKGNEIARTDAGLERNEQAPRSRLEQRHADDISDAEPDIGRTAPVREHLTDSCRIARQDRFDLGSNANEVIRQTVRGPTAP